MNAGELSALLGADRAARISKHLATLAGYVRSEQMLEDMQPDSITALYEKQPAPITPLELSTVKDAIAGWQRQKRNGLGAAAEVPQGDGGVLPPAPKRMCMTKTVAVGAVVDPAHHFFVAPYEEAVFQYMVNQLLNKAYIILAADRQAGKSTTAYCLSATLAYQGFTVVSIDLSTFKSEKYRTAEYVLLRIATKLRASNSDSGSGGQGAGSSAVSAQVQLEKAVDDKGGKCCVFIDGSDELDNFPSEELSILLSCLRSLKGRQPNSMGCLIIGTSYLVHILLTKLEKTLFTRDALYTPPRFGIGDCKALLQQLLRARRASIDLDIDDLAASIHAYTDGHRGLVGICVKEVEQMLTYEQPINVASWAVRQRLLALRMAQGGYSAYYQVPKDLLRLQMDEPVQRLMRKLMYEPGDCAIGISDYRLADGSSAPQRLQWSGVVIYTSELNNTIRISSPMLYFSLMMAAVQPRQYANMKALTDTESSRAVCKWLLLNGLRYTSLACAVARETETTGRQPFEYGVRFDLACAMCGALAHDPIGKAYRALPEVIVPKNAPTRSSPRLHYMFKDGDLPPVNMEFMVLSRKHASAAQAALQTHYTSSKLYATKFGTACFLVVVSVLCAGEQFPEWGCEKRVYTAAGPEKPRTAAELASAHVLNQQQLGDLQTMLDYFPPHMASELLGNQVEPAVAPVGVPAVAPVAPVVVPMVAPVAAPVVEPAVVPVDVLICPDDGYALLRFHNDRIVHRVTLEGSKDYSDVLCFNPHYFQATA